MFFYSFLFLRQKTVATKKCLGRIARSMEESNENLQFFKKFCLVYKEFLKHPIANVLLCCPLWLPVFILILKAAF